MATYKIHPIVMGSKIFDKTMMTYQHGYGETTTIPIYCWYLEGGDKKILVDTGEMSPIQSSDREASLKGKIYTFEEGLDRWDLTPADIDIIIHTHLHNDHCENDYKCMNAEIFEDYIEDVEENGQIRLVEEDTTIVPGIAVMHTPAHTKGGLTVLIDTDNGRAAITGFCVIDENFDPPVEIRAMEMEVIPPGTHIHVQEAYDILVKVRDTADILLPLHEPRFAALDTIP